MPFPTFLFELYLLSSLHYPSCTLLEYLLQQYSLINCAIPNTGDLIIQLAAHSCAQWTAKALAVCKCRKNFPKIWSVKFKLGCKLNIGRLGLVVLLATSADGRRPRKARVGQQVNISIRIITRTKTSIIIITCHCCYSINIPT